MSSRLNAKTPAGVVLTGGGSLTVGALDSCKRIMSLPTRIGVARGLSGLLDEISSPAYTVASGLILALATKSGAGFIIPRQSRRSIGKINLSWLKGVFAKPLAWLKTILP